jgi:thiamine pyrophosphokinase
VRSAVIVIGGSPPPAAIVGALPEPRFVVAADSGYDHAVALGLPVDLLVGDLDSISPAGLADAETSSTVVERHRTDKDATDTELALDAALARGFAHLVVVCGGGDRVDHLLASLFAVAADRYRSARVVLWWGDTELTVVHGGDTTTVTPGADGVFSVLPVHGSASGVDIIGATYPLAGADIAAGSSIGISNVGEPGASVTVRLHAGTLLVVRPHALILPSLPKGSS